jgi:hypothetical protein
MRTSSTTYVSVSGGIMVGRDSHRTALPGDVGDCRKAPEELPASALALAATVQASHAEMERSS